MEVNDQLVHKLAQLSRLNFNAEEALAIKADLQRMISFIDKLQEVDTENVEPLLHITGNINVLRADEIKNQLAQKNALQNAALHNETFFQVPKVIKK